MAKKKITGIRLISRGNYAIDKIIHVEGRRVHLYKEGFRSVSEASEAMPALEEAKRREISPSSCAKTYDELLDLYLENCLTKARVQTVRLIGYIFSKHISPAFTGLNANAAMTYDRVSAWYRQKSQAADISAPRKNKIFSEFRKFAEFAWKRRAITAEAYTELSGIVENVKLPAKPKNEKQTWDFEQERAFLEAIGRDSPDYPMFALFLYLGCRLGEFLGLKWDAYDRQRGEIKIMRQVINDIRGGAVLTEELKTNESYRTNELDPETKALLDEYMDSRDADELRGFMFPSPTSPFTPLSRSGFRRKLYRYTAIAGLPQITPHGARHSKATAFMSVCENMQEVTRCAEFLGHSPSMMADVYSHGRGVSQTDLANRLRKAA